MLPGGPSTRAISPVDGVFTGLRAVSRSRSRTPGRIAVTLRPASSRAVTEYVSLWATKLQALVRRHHLLLCEGARGSTARRLQPSQRCPAPAYRLAAA